jgi:hypothetical protein
MRSLYNHKELADTIQLFNVGVVLLALISSMPRGVISVHREPMRFSQMANINFSNLLVRKCHSNFKGLG